jgi:hypothetical protein
LNFNSRQLKKAPLPWGVVRRGDEPKVALLIRGRFVELYGERSALSTSERKDWGRFLASRGILWDIRVPEKPNWCGWEFHIDERGLVARPEGLEDHEKFMHYYVPRDLATKMLVLNHLP